MSQTRQLTNRKYSFKDYGEPERLGSSGDYTLRRGCPAEIWRPSWDQPTTIRAYPTVLPGSTEFEPYRYLQASGVANLQGTLSDWLRRYPYAKGVGLTTQVSFLLGDPTDPVFNPRLSPLYVLYAAVADAERAQVMHTAQWWKLLKGGQGRSAPLSPPTDVYFVQGALYECGGKQHCDPARGVAPRGGAADDKPVVFIMPRTAGMALVDLLNQKNENYYGSADDFESCYVNGDPVGLANGRFITFFQLGKDPRASMQQSTAQGQRQPVFGGASSRQDQRSGQSTMKGYGVFMEKSWRQIPATLNMPGVPELIRQRWQPWDEVLNFVTFEEQAHILARVFPAQLIMYAFADHPTWIPDDVRNAATSMVSAPVPAGPVNASWNGGPPQAGWGVPQQQQPPVQGQGYAQQGYPPVAEQYPPLTPNVLPDIQVTPPAQGGWSMYPQAPGGPAGAPGPVGGNYPPPQYQQQPGQPVQLMGVYQPVAGPTGPATYQQPAQQPLQPGNGGWGQPSAQQPVVGNAATAPFEPGPTNQGAPVDSDQRRREAEAAMQAAKRRAEARAAGQPVAVG